jgi:hypothetical protein
MWGGLHHWLGWDLPFSNALINRYVLLRILRSSSDSQLICARFCVVFLRLELHPQLGIVRHATEKNTVAFFPYHMPIDLINRAAEVFWPHEIQPLHAFAWKAGHIEDCIQRSPTRQNQFWYDYKARGAAWYDQTMRDGQALKDAAAAEAQAKAKLDAEAEAAGASASGAAGAGGAGAGGGGALPDLDNTVMGRAGALSRSGSGVRASLARALSGGELVLASVASSAASSSSSSSSSSAANSDTEQSILLPRSPSMPCSLATSLFRSVPNSPAHPFTHSLTRWFAGSLVRSVRWGVGCDVGRLLRRRVAQPALRGGVSMGGSLGLESHRAVDSEA